MELRQPGRVRGGYFDYQAATRNPTAAVLLLLLALLWQILAINRRNWIPESDFQ
jgi:hypothetical protein